MNMAFPFSGVVGTMEEHFRDLMALKLWTKAIVVEESAAFAVTIGYERAKVGNYSGKKGEKN